MTQADYQPFVERMIGEYEGGYGWDRGDAGGPTKYGITCYDLAQHRGQHMDSMQRWAPLVRAMTLHEADEIYATKYATQCCFDELGPGKDCVVFDFGVNSGSSRAIRYAQMVVGVPDDGVLGPVTLAAINNYKPADFINKLCDARLRFLRSLRIWGTFGRGWNARVKDLRNYSLKLLPTALGHGFVGHHPKKEKYERKPLRIPLAHVKAYHRDDIKELERPAASSPPSGPSP